MTVLGVIVAVLALAASGKEQVVEGLGSWTEHPATPTPTPTPSPSPSPSPSPAAVPDAAAESAMYVANTCVRGGELNQVGRPKLFDASKTTGCETKHTAEVVELKGSNCQEMVAGWTKWSNRIVASSVEGGDGKLCLVALNKEGALQSVDFRISKVKDKMKMGACALDDAEGERPVGSIPAIPAQMKECGAGLWLHYRIYPSSEAQADTMCERKATATPEVWRKTSRWVSNGDRYDCAALL